MSNSPSNSASTQPPPRQLSVTIAYYIRKLLRQNLDQLTSVVTVGAGIKADPLNDLNAVLESLYLETEEINSKVQELEHLALLHQAISSQGVKHRQELKDAEQQIFWLLGFKLRLPSHQGKILVVDDNTMNVRVLTVALAKYGYEVASADDGVAALGMVEVLDPDLVLLDIMMPKMDGYDVCQRLKENAATRDIPVIFVSAIDRVIDKVKAFGVGGADYIPKPFHMEEVLARIEHQLNLRSLQKRLEEQNAILQREFQERKKAEILYRSMFENSVDGIFQTAPDGGYLRANSSLAQIYGYESPEELIAAINHIGQQLYVQPERRDEFIQKMQHQEKVLNFESQVYRKDGSIIWISESVRRVADTDGSVLLYEGTVRDITNYKTNAE
jgi:PAS domain S-box-containing protein